MQVPDPTPSAELEDKPPEHVGGHNADSSGFGLVNWLFDHIKDRKPMFLSLFRQYDAEAKISTRKVIGSFVLICCLFWDGVIFLIYAVAVAAIVAGITFIFVKGTGILDYVHGNDPSQATGQIEVQTQQVNISNSKH